MTRADYQRLAQVFAQARQDLKPDPDGDIEFAFSVLQERLADALSLDNPRFNRARFDAACVP